MNIIEKECHKEKEIVDYMDYKTICITVKYITIFKWLRHNHIKYGNFRFLSSVPDIQTSDFNHIVITSHLLCFDVL